MDEEPDEASAVGSDRLPVVAEPVGARVPDDLNAIAEIIGPDAARALADKLGGRWFHIAIERYSGPLPGLLAEIDRLIGRELALRFAIEFGGRRVYVPTREGLRPDSRLVGAVGMAAAERLVDEFGGGIFWTVPLGPLSFGWMRVMRIRSLLMQGFSAPEIARQCSITERSVYKQKALLVEFNILPRSGPVKLSDADQLAGSIRLLLAENTAPIDVARQLAVSIEDVEREAVAMKPVQASGHRPR